jgi:NhaA family Na+:H+ antiporter
MIQKLNLMLQRFLQLEAAGGILLVVAAAIAMILANTPLSFLYNMLIDIPMVIQIGALEIAKPLLLWVNDGLMAVFFLLVGLELKRELIEGELTSAKKVVLPAFGAIGGMLVPALVYVYFNHDDPSAISGWAIPAATDVAFALGVLSLLGKRVPNSLKIFLISLAIFDDVGAIIIIAFFYTSKISMLALVVTAICLVVLFIMNRKGVLRTGAYVFVGAIMWTSLLKSGVHATLAGVALAMFIPIKTGKSSEQSPLIKLEHSLQAPVAFFILPFFAFCNAGLTFNEIGVEQLTHSIPLGIALGLFVGKQLGVFAFCWLSIQLRLAERPSDMSWSSLYGVAVLCGIGFTMSLFIGSLAFQETGLNRVVDERLGIIMGSLLSGIFGYLILRASLAKRAA